MKRIFPFLLVVLLLTLGSPIPASAHASLVRSVPEAGDVLAQSPQEIELEFSEELDPAVTRVEILDSTGRILNPGPGVIDPGTPRLLRLEVETLPEGAYSAVWQARSTVDGHVTGGSVGFSIGKASPAPSLLPPPGTPDPATATPSAVETFARWLGYLSASVAAGSLGFAAFIWRPAYASGMSPAQETEETVRRLLRQVIMTSLVILGLATILRWANSTAASPGILTGQFDWLLVARLVLVLFLGGLVARLSSPGRGSFTAWGVSLAIAGGLLLTFSLQGHGAASGLLAAVVVDWLHLAATAVWLGGLPMLLLTLRQAGFPAAVLVPRYSRVSLTCVGLLAGTGLYHFIVYVGSVDALVSTTYGRAVLVKTGLFALLIALGAVNLLVLSPRLRGAGETGRTGLSRTVRLEMVVGVLLLLAVGVLTGVAPAYEALQVRQEQGFIETATVDGVHLLVRVAPGEAGENEIGIEFRDPRPGAESAAPVVLVRLAADGLGTQEIDTSTNDGLRFTARGSYFPLQGPWEVEIIIRRHGFEDVRHAFTLDIRERSSP